MVALDSLQKGDLIAIEWRDIAEDPSGDPNQASLAKRHSIGYFWAIKEDDGIPVVITTTTIDLDVELVDGSQGYCIYPIACIAKVKVIKRKRKTKEKKERVINGEAKN